jgi:hypothetical protein
MYEVALKIIGRVLEQGRVASLLANLGVAFAERVQALFLWRLDNQRVNVCRPAQSLSILEFHELCMSYFFVPGSSDTIVNVQLINTSSSFTFSPSCGAFATCIVISRLDLPVAYVTRPDNCKSHISVRGEWMVMRSQLAVTVVTSSPVCLSVCILRPIGFLCRYWGLHAMIPESASRSMKIVPRRMCPEELRYVSRSHGSRAKGSTTE